MEAMPHMRHYEVAAAIHGNLALDFGGFSLCESYISTWRIGLIIDIFVRSPKVRMPYRPVCPSYRQAFARDGQCTEASLGPVPVRRHPNHLQ